MQELNRYHQFELSVWADGVLHFEQPSALDDYDWEIRIDDPGTSVDLQGDSVDLGVFNGVVVTYTDFAGTQQILYPTSYAVLADVSETNPANLWGLQRWTSEDIPFPTTQADALQIGRTALAEATQAKAPGTLAVRGHIRDRWGIGSRPTRFELATAS